MMFIKETWHILGIISFFCTVSFLSGMGYERSVDEYQLGYLAGQKQGTCSILALHSADYDETMRECVSNFDKKVRVEFNTGQQ